MSKPIKIYLAGPEVFLPDPIDAGARLKEICTAHGATGLYPFDNPLGSHPTNSVALANHIRDANMAMIRACDAVVANMAPFRGPSMDVGTAYEMGVASALGKVVVAYSADSRSYVEKVEESFKIKRGADGMLRDENLMSVEEFGKGKEALLDNLMVTCGYDMLCKGSEEAIKAAIEIFHFRSAKGR